MSEDSDSGRNNLWPDSAETMTGAQRIYLQRLCEQAGVAFDGSWTEAQALERIKTLEARTGKA
ncbi:DUF3072 domain-containing protein [Endozoicomonas sp. G2_2]|uniref:DUF3072 domain-containing protein n=1 Tax=Endozoicomonas sp. G2_2 TaxID=2821092 RepID=UPI001ADB2C93|nr:DUF3072 domain-containing protein [Endozoicomonas sp. G2_2]MBO9470583.1 DUF3072 domain-containing protein [Endozoicomonas sp. G2_2]